MKIIVSNSALCNASELYKHTHIHTHKHKIKIQVKCKWMKPILIVLFLSS